MSLEAGIKSHLLSRDLITDLIGERLYPSKNPQSNTTFPVVIWARTKTERPQGVNYSAPTFAEFMFTAYSEDYEVGISIGAALRNVLQGFQGTMGAVDVHNVWITDEYDGYLTDPDGNDLGFYQRIVPIRIQYIEAEPTLPDE